MPSAAFLPRRQPRISLRRRLRGIFRLLRDLVSEIIATSGHRRGREDFMQLAAREALERSEALEASVGAMSAADIRRIAPSSTQPQPRR